MKIFKTLFSVILVSSLLYSCSSEKKPDDVAIAYQIAFAKLDFDKAAEYSSEKTKIFLASMQSIKDLANKDESGEVQEEVDDTKIEVASCKCSEIGEDKQKCLVVLKGEEEEEKENIVILSKIDGKWLVDMTKEDAGFKGKEETNDNFQFEDLDEDDDFDEYLGDNIEDDE